MNGNTSRVLSISQDCYYGQMKEYIKKGQEAQQALPTVIQWWPLLRETENKQERSRKSDFVRGDPSSPFGFGLVEGCGWVPGKESTVSEGKEVGAGTAFH